MLHEAGPSWGARNTALIRIQTMHGITGRFRLHVRFAMDLNQHHHLSLGEILLTDFEETKPSSKGSQLENDLGSEKVPIPHGLRF